MREPRLRQPTDLELVTSPPQRNLGGAAFSIADPVAWDSLPKRLRTAPSLATFKRGLKRYIYRVTYDLTLLKGTTIVWDFFVFI